MKENDRQGPIRSPVQVIAAGARRFAEQDGRCLNRGLRMPRRDLCGGGGLGVGFDLISIPGPGVGIG
jgi:hypothetical protein